MSVRFGSVGTHIAQNCVLVRKCLLRKGLVASARAGRPMVKGWYHRKWNSLLCMSG